MAKILDMDKKYQVILIVLLLCFVLVVGIAVVTSIFLDKKIDKYEDVALATTDNGLAINYVNGNVFDFSSVEKKNYGITITNTSNEKIYYSIDFNLKKFNHNFSVLIVDEEDNIIEEFEVNKKYDGKLLNLMYINANETVRYDIVFKFNTKTSIKGSFNVINEIVSSDVFVDVLINNIGINEPQSMVGGEISDTDEGFISSVDNRGTAYFLRGNINNNYVKIDEHLFRVVRINGDNSVRLISEESIGNYVFNNNPLNWELGVASLADFSMSTLYNDLNDWFNTELSDYNKFIVDGDYCIESDYSNIIGDKYYSKAYERIFVDSAPMLSCENKFTSKIGLLSVDEVIYAGAFKNNINKKYYLYNEKLEDGYLTLTGLYWNNNMMMININGNGSIGDGLMVTEESAIRPVINISAKAKVVGNGTKDKPYVIVDSL